MMKLTLPPPPSTQGKTINETELFQKYKSSYTPAFIDLSVHAFLMCSSFYSLHYFRNSWLSVLTIPFLGLLNVKTFQIFHDCGHNAYTPNKNLNYIVGLLLSGVITHPFFWRHNHNIHHLTNGNIENTHKYSFNETIYHTTKQYKAFSNVTRCLYKFVRSPLVFFFFTVYFRIFIFNQFKIFRFILYTPHGNTTPKKYLLLEQVLSTSVFFLILHVSNLFNIFFHFLTSALITASLGALTVHSHHTFNPSYVTGNNDWNYKNSGLKSTALLKLPHWLIYFASGIDYHHIHHLNAKIPSYNLKKCHEEVVSKSNMFDNVIKLSMTDCYNNLWLVLYDDEKKRYITFAEADKEIINYKDM